MFLSLLQDLKTFLDKSKYGVIYISFGTNAIPSQLPPEKIQMFVKVFSQLPYDVLWKWDKDELPGRTENIRISKWLPQSDLLRHPKIKLFITQGGLQSTDEAINAGVPLLAVPLLGDQWYNAEKYIRYTIGKKVEMGTLKEVELKSAIESIIGDERYLSYIVPIFS
ncbi:UDP-glycosyltransferase UGT33B11 [Operophtera brumata]|uniref:UDP-glucuronosyltransferase n=1 Tax=Operophtera brumata TaxID=104452 RepID=A0A0L7LGN7_OPEBR|nr:UDP-glycosyltransferase UGT33B11 [Operophtera brumata]